MGHHIVELRQYRLHPGTRETLIALFDRELVESQEATGMQVIAQFRDVDRPDVFTWLRGFPSMTARATSLAAFYDGPVWARHRDAANATMISSDDVRLLGPVWPGAEIVVGDRPPAGVSRTTPGLAVVTVYTLAASGAGGFAEHFERLAVPLLTAHGGAPIAMLETEQSINSFPRLPVREEEHAFVWMARFDDVATHDRHVTELAADAGWAEDAYPSLARGFTASPEVLRLEPTSRSRIL
jgi:hypothetical protein